MFPTRLVAQYLHTGLRRMLGRPVYVSKDTVEPEIVFPGQEYNFTPALALPGQVDKILADAFAKDTSRAIEKLQGGTQYRGPVQRLTLRDAVVTGKFVFAGGLMKPFWSKADWRLLGQLPERANGAIPSSYHGTNYFGHWLGDDTASYLLAEREVDAPPVIMPFPNWGEQPDYAHRFGQDWAPTPPAFYRRLNLYIDHGQNPHKAERLTELRRRFRTASPRDKGSADIVYLKRGPGSSERRLTNEAEVIERLSARGCHIHEAESGVEVLEAAALNARIIIGVEGSQLLHALYMLRDAGGLLVLQPPKRFFVSNLDWCRVMGFEFAYVVGDPEGEAFSMDLDDLDRTLDLLDNALK